jgi:hypothetical protein
MQLQAKRARNLVVVKLLHTLVWAVVAASILAIPLAGLQRQFQRAAVFTGIVLVECLILAANWGRCPLTDLAGRFTDDRVENFDIYLPLWVARHNKLIFGILFMAGEIVVLQRWFSLR